MLRFGRRKSSSFKITWPKALLMGSYDSLQFCGLQQVDNSEEEFQKMDIVFCILEFKNLKLPEISKLKKNNE